ncbi:MAG: DUF1828 domain-containing protein [Candidatus Hatepunaea meridiana]|nr:DUF1828 domain-containing protein [Candidatus Hatepunaea meridiana]
MVLENIEQDFKRKVCDEVRLFSEGLERYRVFTPFMFEDGDHLAIVLKRENNKWILTDEGHTYMHLTYDIDEKDLQEGTRSKIINNVLSTFSVDDRNGELIVNVRDGQFGNALYSYVQALLKISDLTFLSRESVKSTFMDDFKNLIEETVDEKRRTFDWYDEKNDPDGKYMVDCRINGRPDPLLVFALKNDAKVRDTTIGLLQFEKWGMKFRSLGIFENQEEINRKVLARFSDACEKQFSSLAANKGRIMMYFEDGGGGG